jgi:hypothetical protein
MYEAQKCWLMVHNGDEWVKYKRYSTNKEAEDAAEALNYRRKKRLGWSLPKSPQYDTSLFAPLTSLFKPADHKWM